VNRATLFRWLADQDEDMYAAIAGCKAMDELHPVEPELPEVYAGTLGESVLGVSGNDFMNAQIRAGAARTA
jgi:hypothetical protein